MVAIIENAFKNKGIAANLEEKKTEAVDMEAEYLNPETDDDVTEELKEKVKKIQDLFPQKLSEAETSSD